MQNLDAESLRRSEIIKQEQASIEAKTTAIVQAYAKQHFQKDPKSTQGDRYTQTDEPGSQFDLSHFSKDGSVFRSPGPPTFSTSDDKKMLVLADWRFYLLRNAPFYKHSWTARQKILNRLKKLLDLGFKLCDQNGDPLQIAVIYDRTGTQWELVSEHNDDEHFSGIPAIKAVLDRRGFQSNDYCLLTHDQLEGLVSAPNTPSFILETPTLKALGTSDPMHLAEASNIEHLHEWHIDAAYFNQLDPTLWAQCTHLPHIHINVTDEMPDIDRLNAFVKQVPLAKIQLTLARAFNETPILQFLQELPCHVASKIKWLDLELRPDGVSSHTVMDLRKFPSLKHLMLYGGKARPITLRHLTLPPSVEEAIVQQCPQLVSVELSEKPAKFNVDDGCKNFETIIYSGADVETPQTQQRLDAICQFTSLQCNKPISWQTTNGAYKKTISSDENKQDVTIYSHTQTPTQSSGEMKQAARSDAQQPPATTLDFYEKRTRTLHAHTRIEEIAKPSFFGFTAKNKYIPANNYHQNPIIQIRFNNEALELIESPFVLTTPAVFSKEEPTHQAITEIDCIRGNPIRIATLGPYDTLTAPNNFADYGDIYGPDDYGCYTFVPSQTGPAEIRYSFLNNDPEKLNIPSAIKQYPLPDELEEGLALSLDNLNALPKPFREFLKQVDHFKKLRQEQRTPKAISEFDAVVRKYFDPGFKSENPSAKGLDFLNHMPSVQSWLRMLAQQRGVCRHRAALALAIYQYVGLPAYEDYNGLHAFIRILRQKTPQWTSVDLGGGRTAQIQHSFKAVPKEQPKQNSKPAEQQVTVVDEKKEENEDRESEFADTFKVATEQVIRQHTDTNTLLTWVANQPRLLIWTNSTEQSKDLYGALYPIIKARAEANVFYIESAQDLRNFVKTLVIKEGRFTFKSLFSSEEKANAEIGHVVINWSGFSTEEMLTYKDGLFDAKQPKVNGIPLPANLNVTHLAQSGKRVCQSFSSLFKPEETLAWPKNNPNYELSQTSSITVEAATTEEKESHEEKKSDAADTVRKDAYGSIWQPLLAGRIGVQKDEFSFIEGALEKAIVDKKLGFVLIDPPIYAAEFRRFWFCLTVERRFLANGKWIELPEYFSLRLEAAPENRLLKHVEIEHVPVLSEDSEEKEEENKVVSDNAQQVVQPRATLDKTAFDKIICFFHYLEKIPHGKRGTPREATLSHERLQNSMDALLSREIDRNNPLKPFFMHDYRKHSEAYAFANVIAKMLFADYAPIALKDEIRIHKLKTLSKKFEGMPNHLWQWQRLNCCSGAYLRALFDIKTDADIATLLRESSVPGQQLPQVNEVRLATLDAALHNRLHEQPIAWWDFISRFSNKKQKSPVEKTKAPSMAKSMRRMERFLNKQGKVLLKGPPGTGKTYAAIEYAKKRGSFYYGLTAIAECLSAAKAGKEQVVLVLDEINMVPSGSLSLLDEIVKAGGQVIGTANEEFDSDMRHLDPTIQNFPTVYVKEWSQEERIETLLLPLASVLSLPGLDEKSQREICTALVKLFDIAQACTSNDRISTRDLHQMLLRFEQRWQIAQTEKPTMSWQAVLMTVISDEYRAEELIEKRQAFKKQLFSFFKGKYSAETEAALSVYFDGYKKARHDQKALDHYLHHYQKVACYDKTTLPNVLTALKDQGHYVLAHREQDIALLVENILIDQRKQRLAPDFDPAITGKSGVLITGTSGIGKSTALQIILSTLGINAKRVTIGEPHAALHDLTTAFEAEQAVIADELDLAGGTLELPLNNMLTGKDKTGKPRSDKRALALYGSCNGETYEGRKPLPAPLKNRLHLISALAYSTYELNMLAEQSGLTRPQASRFVSAYLAGCQENPEQINMRTFFEKLKSSVAKIKQEAPDALVSLPAMPEETKQENEDMLSTPSIDTPTPAMTAPHNPPSVTAPISPASVSCLPYTETLFNTNQYRPVGKKGRYGISTQPGLISRNQAMQEIYFASDDPLEVQRSARRLDDAMMERQQSEGALSHTQSQAKIRFRVFPKQELTYAKHTLSAALDKIKQIEQGGILLESHDPNFVSEALVKQFPHGEVFTVSTEDRWNTLFEGAQKMPSSRANLRFDYQWKSITEKLLAGETVILKGHASNELIKSLASLFTPTPHLVLNGDIVPVSGRLLMAVHPLTEKHHGFAPDRTMRVDKLFSDYRATFFAKEKRPGSLPENQVFQQPAVTVS